ncbi:MAG: DUF433 domain-containing protein, partial [Acidobacteria bacterium]|nr:DUF433 domain-containing protein [Acidobacteriota bacterium]
MRFESVIVSNPEVLGGTPCFRGTRVPVDSLIDYLEAGDSLNEFLDNFPSVSPLFSRHLIAAQTDAADKLEMTRADPPRVSRSEICGKM